jgi:hypothetical protein
LGGKKYPVFQKNNLILLLKSQSFKIENMIQKKIIVRERIERIWVREVLITSVF